MQEARLERDDLVRSTALEVSQTQAPRHFCDACNEPIDRGGFPRLCPVDVSSPYDARWDMSKTTSQMNAIAQGHDTIPCPLYGLSSGHGFHAWNVLRVDNYLDSDESEADRRSLDARILAVSGQLQRSVANSW